MAMLSRGAARGRSPVVPTFGRRVSTGGLTDGVHVVEQMLRSVPRAAAKVEGLG